MGNVPSSNFLLLAAFFVHSAFDTVSFGLSYHIVQHELRCDPANQANVVYTAMCFPSPSVVTNHHNVYGSVIQNGS